MTAIALAGARPQLPLRTRLKAWWDGCDPRDFAPVAKPKLVRAASPKEADVVAAMAAEEATVEPPKVKPWSPERIALLERLWGEGLHTPGGADHLLELMKPLVINQTMTLLDFGCGLGGGARAAATTFGTWATGIEWSSDLALAGVERSTRAGMVQKAAVRYHALDSLTLKASTYNGVFSKEALFTVPDKARILRILAEALRVGGQLCFTDYVAAQDGDPSERFAAWQGVEPMGASPWTVAGYTDALKALGFDIRVAEDMSDRHCQLIRQGWRTLVEAMKPGAVSPELLPIVVREAEIWARREALIAAGELRLYRFFALKPQ